MPSKNAHHNFYEMLTKHKLMLLPLSIETLWVNITRLCNQACIHCHVGASPNRTEQMERRTVDRCLEILAEYESCRNLDITGGAPELNPNFDYFVTEARKLNKRVVVRHNLTVIFDGNPQTGEKKAYLPEFFAGNRVEILASLPHYTESLTDRIRGQGVFKKSIAGIRLLNALGYGEEDSGLILNLVYNHSGPLSVTDSKEIEAEFKRELMNRYGLLFNRLLTVTNTPINRFRLQLQKSDTYDEYATKLVSAFTPAATETLVCRSLISVGYDGRVYDCDFNQMLDLPVYGKDPATIFNVNFGDLINRQIRFHSHCFGCTAGGGSS